MSETVGDFILQRISQWGVKRVFGYPGDGINGIMGAFTHGDHGIRFIQVRHEEMAAFMACAHAKFTGEVGVCLATSGPGAIHLLNGLYDAQLDHQPVVAIVGQQASMSLGGNYQQEVDLLSLFKDVAHEYIQMATSPAQVRHLIDRAFRISKAERTVTCVIIPHDIQEATAVEQPPHTHGAIHSGVGHASMRVIPRQEDLQRAAQVLNQGKRVAMLVGQGALGAGAEVLQVADILGAGIAKALLGKAVVPDELPNVTGAIGLVGTKPSWNLMSDCDTLLMVGSSFPYSEFLPKEGQARAVQIDIDPRMLSLRYPMEVNLVGDSAETLRALVPLLQKKADRAWRDKIREDISTWWQVLKDRSMVEAKPINPQRVFWELSPRLPEKCIISADSGSGANWFARDLKIRKGMMASLSGTLATMGPAVPYAVAAKFAYPGRPILAIAGDGAMQMNGLNELITIAKYWKEWEDPRLVVLVLNNRDLNMVTWEMRAMSGDPRFDASQDIPDFQYARYAQSLGLAGVRVERPEAIAPAFDRAFTADRPLVIDAVVDPEVPPLPPHITLEQAKAFASATLKDPAAPHFVRQTIKDSLQSFLPHKGSK